MDTTPVSLLERLREPNAEADWARFVTLATPLLKLWARALGLKGQDAEDLVQEVLVVLVEKLPDFAYDRDRSFRGWMRTIAVNKWRERQRRGAMLALDAIPWKPGDLAEDAEEMFWEREFREQLVKQALRIMKSDFQPTTWKACWEHVVSDRPAAEVAAELGITPGAVYIAKSRVLKRLREELQGWCE